MAGGAPGPISCITTGEQVLQTLSFEKVNTLKVVRGIDRIPGIDLCDDYKKEINTYLSISYLSIFSEN